MLVAKAFFSAASEALLQIGYNARHIANSIYKGSRKAVAEAKGIQNVAYSTGILIRQMNKYTAEQIMDLHPGEEIEQKYRKLRELNRSSPYLVAKIDEAYAVLHR